MLARSLKRPAARQAAGLVGRSALRLAAAQPVPDCAVTFGHSLQFTFMSNPAVMAVSNILELQGVVQMRANFTLENIEAMKEFDEELARKAQIAFDNDLSINFKDLETIEDDLDRLKIEQQQLTEARKEVMARKIGDYGPLKTDISATKGQSLEFVLDPKVIEKLKGK